MDIDPDLADQVQELTCGRQDLAAACVQMLTAATPQTALLPWLTEPGGPVAGLVRQQLDGLSPEARKLLDDVAELAPVTPALAAALGHTASLVTELSEAGILVRDQVIPAVAQVCRDQRRGTPPWERAASWYQENGLVAAAVKASGLADDLVHCGQLLDGHGDELVARGQAGLVTEILERIPPKQRSRQQQLLLGDAQRTAGSPMKAGQAYAAVADAEPVWDAGLAWRMGQVQYHRGDSVAALKAFARAEPGTGTEADQSLLLSWTASAQLQLGETASAIESATLACKQAVAAGNATAEATAYVSLALCHSVAGNPTDSDELLAQALDICERTGNIVIRSRVLTTQTFRLIGEARYAEALDTARRTGQCAAAAGHSNMRLVALYNEADILLMLGRLDEAIRQYERAQSFSRRMGSRRTAAAQVGLGEVYRQRGWAQQARAAFEAAISLAAESGQRDIHVNALAGLARLLLAEDLAAAAKAADEAVSLGFDRLLVLALLAKGWVTLYSGDSAGAAMLADEATAAARAERYPAGLADCLELRAATEPDPKRARAALREALAIWTSAGCAVHAARVRTVIGGLADASTDDRLSSLLAAEMLASAGITVDSRHTESAVEIRAFGRFEVLLDGDVVPPAQWQSRKARDLLRILVARRGRPIPRGELCELLWPDDDPSKTGHRLSVLLSIIRGVLDPAKCYPAEHYLVADQSCIGLDVTRMRVDVEEFMADTGHGRRLWERGAEAEAYRLLSAAVQAYRAEVFEDEPYAEWSGAIREEARAAYLGALRLLAKAGRKLGHLPAAVGYLLQLLTIDPYDEAAHRELIEALAEGGQHGEARRAHGRYEKAMHAIGVRPSYRYTGMAYQ